MTWSERFTAYVLQRYACGFHEIPRDRIARDLKTTKTSVHYWLHGAEPRAGTRKRIETWSKGAVPANLSLYTRRPSVPPMRAAPSVPPTGTDDSS